MKKTSHFAMTAAAVTAIAAMVGFTVPAEARHLSSDRACHWVYNTDHGRHGRYGHRHRGHRGLLNPREIRRSIRHQGFRRIHDIEFNRGVYKAEARGRHGHPVKVFADGRTGRVLCTAPLYRSGLSRQKVIERLHGLGYRRISDLFLDSRFYRAVAVDRDGHRHRIKIDPRTGAVWY